MVEIYGYSVATLPIITAIVYGFVEFFKKFVFFENDIFKKYIPVIATITGGIMGLIAFFTDPSIIPSSTWYGSIIIGCASGLSSVGVNQITKQIKKGGENGGS